MNKAVLAVGAAAAVLVLPLVLIAGFGGDTQATADTSALNENLVPAQYQAVLAKAGQTCATFTGPVLAAQIQQESDWNPAARSAAGVEGCVAIDDEEVEGAVEGQDYSDARKFPLEERARFVRHYARDVGHVLVQHHRKGGFAADDERSGRPARVVVVDVYGT